LRRSTYGDLKKLAAISSWVLILPSSIIAGLAIGYLLDRWLKTAPWMLLIWTILGIISGLLNLFRSIRRHFEEAQKSSRGANNQVDSQESDK